MKNLIILLAALGLVSLLGCQIDDGSGQTFRVVEGTITVPDSGYWTYLKLGLFSGGTSGTYSALDYDDNGSGVDSYRLIYDDARDSSLVDVSQVAGTTSTISASGDTSRTYSFELPATLPIFSDEYYHFAAWYDEDLDDTLAMADTVTPATIIANSEFNRLPTKATTNSSDNPTTITIFYFIESQDLGGNPSGNYKYVGWDDAAYNEQKELDSSTNSNLNFAITAHTAW